MNGSKQNGVHHNCPVTDGLGTLEQFLDRHQSVRFLRFQWQDHAGILRARLVPVECAKKTAAGEHTLCAPPTMFRTIVDNSSMPGLDPRGNYRLLPDWGSLKTWPGFNPLYATAMCNVEKFTIPVEAGKKGDRCPRTALAKIVQKAAETFGITFLVGFEVEFEMMKRSAGGHLMPYSAGYGRFAVSGLRDPSYAAVEEAMQALLDAGVHVESFHTEGNTGQYEISLGPLPPLPAVDQLLQVHDTLKEVGVRHGCIITMSPRPVAERHQGSGQHTHISIHPPANNDAFLAGMLQRLQGLCALTMPHHISYERVQPGMVGDVIGWGTENRDSPIRQIKHGHWEVRCVDSTANMYLALAAMLGAGLLGIANRESLSPWPDQSLSLSPSSQNYALRYIPLELSSALDSLAQMGAEMEDMLESDILHHYLALKDYEQSVLRRMELEQVRQLFVELF